MRISLTTLLSDSQGVSPVDAFVGDVRSARDQGFGRVWVAQLPWEHDALTTLAVAAREVDGIGLATGVQPIQGRHPMVLAQAALTLNLIAGGRFTLGIGLTHEFISDGMWGIPWDRPVRRLNEYLDGLLPLLAGDPVDAFGATSTTRGALQITPTPAPPVYVAALGPQLLKIAGARTAG